jgi:hypothetical protein
VWTEVRVILHPGIQNVGAPKSPSLKNTLKKIAVKPLSFSARWVLDPSCLKKPEETNSSSSSPGTQSLNNNGLTQKWRESNEKASQNKSWLSSFPERAGLLGLLLLFPSVAIIAANGHSHGQRRTDIQKLTQELDAEKDKFSGLDRNQAINSSRHMDLLKNRIAEKENALQQENLKSGLLKVVLALSGITMFAGLGTAFLRGFGARGTLYLKADPFVEEIQRKFQSDALPLGEKRQKILEACPELKAFLSVLYGQNLPSTPAGHAKQLEDVWATQLYLNLVPQNQEYVQDSVIEASAYYKKLNQKLTLTSSPIDYFPELTLLQELVRQDLKAGKSTVQKTFRPLMDAVESNQDNFEEGVKRLTQSLENEMEPSLLFLQSQWVQSLLLGIPKEEVVNQQNIEMSRIKRSLQEKNTLIQELESQCETFHKKIETPGEVSPIEGAKEGHERHIDSDVEAYHQAKRVLLQTQLDSAKLQVEKLSLEQKLHEALFQWTAAQQSTFNAHQAFKALSLEKTEMLRIHQQLLLFSKLKQEYPETLSQDTLSEVEPLQKLLEKEKHNPVLESVESASQEASK